MNFSGVTRDRHYGKTNWNGKDFTVVDTGGYVKNSDNVFDAEIRKQVQVAIDEAQVIVFVVDVMTGVVDLDQEVAQLLRQSQKKIFLVVNKVDNHKRAEDAVEFYGLGLGEYYCVSSINGSGTGDVLDGIVKDLPDTEFVDEYEGLPRFAVVGRPNAGKSSLINSLIGEERNIVTDIAGTTRDTNDIRFNAYGFDFVLVDTAGIRRKKKVHEDLEFYSVMRAIKALERADVCIVMIDAVEGISSQDLNIIGLAIKNNKGVVVLFNKWDLIEKETNTARDMEISIKEKLEPFDDVNILFISVHEKQRLHRTLESAVAVYENRAQKIKNKRVERVAFTYYRKEPSTCIKR